MAIALNLARKRGTYNSVTAGRDRHLIHLNLEQEMSLSHHDGSHMQQSELLKMLEAQREGTAKRAWPDGRLNGSDDGQLAFSVGPSVNGNLVAVDFGKMVSQIAMTPDEAIQMAQMLIKHARQVSPSPVTVVLH